MSLQCRVASETNQFHAEPALAEKGDEQLIREFNDVWKGMEFNEVLFNFFQKVGTSDIELTGEIKEAVEFVSEDLLCKLQEDDDLFMSAMFDKGVLFTLFENIDVGEYKNTFLKYFIEEHF